MKPFRLDAVLSHRKRTENTVRKEILSMEDARESLVLEQRGEEMELERLYGELRDAGSRNEILVSDILMYESCIYRKKKELKGIAKKIEEMDARIRRQQKKLVKACQDTRALEILKENRAREEREKEQRAEKRSADEVAVLCFGGGK